jgi:hypothetical protein
MKYIISESKLEQVITEYIDGLFPIDEINYTNPDVYDDEQDGEIYEDENMVQFYLGNYDEGENNIFLWLGTEYFEENSSAQDRSPIVVVDHPYDDQLIAYFNDAWEEPFKKWFMKNFNLPVKTVEWKRMID